MATETLFEGNQDNDVIVDPNKPYLEELVGEGKKYADHEALAKGAVFKDAHIKRIEEENRLLREQVQSGLTMKEFLDQMKSTRETVPPSNQPNQSGETENPENNTFTKEAVENLVRNVLSENQQRVVEAQNLEKVTTVLSEQLGSNYSVVLRDKARALGVSEQFIDNLAKTTPKGLFALLGIDEDARPTPSVFAPPASGVRTSPGAVKGNAKNWNYYEKIRREDPSRYNSLAVHKEMMEQLAAQGDDFYK